MNISLSFIEFKIYSKEATIRRYHLFNQSFCKLIKIQHNSITLEPLTMTMFFMISEAFYISQLSFIFYKNDTNVFESTINIVLTYIFNM